MSRRVAKNILWGIAISGVCIAFKPEVGRFMRSLDRILCESMGFPYRPD